MKKIFFVVAVFVFLFAGVTAFAQMKGGKYEAKDAADKQGYAGSIEIVVADGKIVKVDYTEFKGKDDKKKNNYVNTEMKKRSKISFAEAAAKLEANLIASQNPDKVDAVTGATGLSKRFVELAKKALPK